MMIQLRTAYTLHVNSLELVWTEWQFRSRSLIIIIGTTKVSFAFSSSSSGKLSLLSYRSLWCSLFSSATSSRSSRRPAHSPYLLLCVVCPSTSNSNSPYVFITSLRKALCGADAKHHTHIYTPNLKCIWIYTYTSDVMGNSVLNKVIVCDGDEVVRIHIHLSQHSSAAVNKV